MSSNGHEPTVTDLGAILERTEPSRTLRIPAAAIREDSLTYIELASIGRALDMTPDQLLELVRTKDGWLAVELAQAFAWAILRRVEPAVTWEEAQRYRLDIVPDPTPAAVVPPRRRGARSE